MHCNRIVSEIEQNTNQKTSRKRVKTQTLNLQLVCLQLSMKKILVLLGGEEEQLNTAINNTPLIDTL